jgi:cytochrome c peroxidase
MDHPIRYDASKGGSTFFDPDGDPLTYTVRVTNWSIDTAGPWIERGPPPFVGVARGSIVASDGRGGETTDGFDIFVDPNRPPVVSRPNPRQITVLGAHINHDLTQGGLTFTEANNDPLTYTVEMVSPPSGIILDGMRAVGALTTNIAAFRITANDGFGLSASDTFVVAAPLPLPGRPTLPAIPYQYADEDLTLPQEFRQSLAGLNPFWDTANTQRKPVTNAGATLGRVLFYDKRLSLINTHACASCHVQARGFATGDRFPVGVIGAPLKRNALALANSRYTISERYFIDHRALSLEHLALQPIEEVTELASPLPLVIDKLRATDFYPDLFQAAFGTPEINGERMALALAQFLRSIVSYRTRFDQAFMHAAQGSPDPDPAQFLTPLELEGRLLFLTSDCATCHRTAIQTLDFASNNGLDATLTDPGIDGRFRSASLRNIAVTGPYMHDGRFATLREVIDHYDQGIVDSPFLHPRLRSDLDGKPIRLNLTSHEKDALEAFLHALTDDALLTDPKFSDPFQ